jgi:hypothetical protein
MQSISALLVHAKDNYNDHDKADMPEGHADEKEQLKSNATSATDDTVTTAPSVTSTHIGDDWLQALTSLLQTLTSLQLPVQSSPHHHHIITNNFPRTHIFLLFWIRGSCRTTASSRRDRDYGRTTRQLFDMASGKLLFRIRMVWIRQRIRTIELEMNAEVTVMPKRIFNLNPMQL